MTNSGSGAGPPRSWGRSAGSARPRGAGSNAPPPAERSAPAQNARPAPVTITARTVSSASAASKASTSSPSVVAVTALSFSGRASVTSATPSATSYRISAKPIAARASGAEESDAELFAGARRGGRRGRGGRRRELLELGRHRAREQGRSEERRVGEEGRFRWAPEHLKKKTLHRKRCGAWR